MEKLSPLGIGPKIGRITIVVVAYLIFKKFIHIEYEEMEKIFGDEYRLCTTCPGVMHKIKPGTRN